MACGEQADVRNRCGVVLGGHHFLSPVLEPTIKYIDQGPGVQDYYSGVSGNLAGSFIRF
jgi:hypothetical protein